MEKALKPGDAVGRVLGTERDLEAPVTAVLWVEDRFAFATGEGKVWFATLDLAAADVAESHDGAILSAATFGDKILTGGDDGRLVVSDPRNPSVCDVVWQSPGRRWIDHVAAAPDGTMAWSCAKRAYVRQGSVISELDLPAAAGGIAFAPNSNRLAISHYGGVTLWDLVEDTTQSFEWKGAHLEVRWSPDERFILTAMQDGELHGWRAADGSDFAMRGYPGKPRSMSFSRKGDWLATSGAFECVIWPFRGKGPMGTTPEQLARRTHMVTAVAYHPLNAYVATGYDDGVVLLARQEDRRELMVRRSGKGPVTGLAWAASGKQLAYGTDEGMAGIVDFSAINEASGR